MNSSKVKRNGPAIIEQNEQRISRERIYDLIAKFVNRKLDKNILVKKS